MRSTGWLGVLVLALLPLACGTQDIETSDEVAESTSAATSNSVAKPNIVATTSVICDLTQQLANDAIELTCLLAPGQDPHTYEPTPKDRAAIDDADLILYGGHGFSPDIEQLIAATTSPSSKVPIYEVAVPEPLTGASTHDHHEETGDHHEEADDHHARHSHAEHAEADDHHDHGSHAEHAEASNHDDHADRASHDGHTNDELNVADPHIWHSARNGIAITDAIAAELTTAMPEQREEIEAQQALVTDQLTNLHDWIQIQVDTIPEGDRKLVTTHSAFGYFADAYGFEVAGALSGITTEQAPSAERLAELVDLVRATQVKAVFAETTTNRNIIQTVARDAGVTVPSQALFVDGPGDANTPASNYQQMLEINTCTIVTGLGGSCQVKANP